MKFFAPIRNAMRDITRNTTLVAVAILLELTNTANAQANLNSSGTNDPIAVLKAGFCGDNGINSYLVNGTFLFISLLIGVIIYGWSMRFGKREAGTALGQAVIGTLIVAGSTTFAKAFVSNGC